MIERRALAGTALGASIPCAWVKSMPRSIRYFASSVTASIRRSGWSETWSESQSPQSYLLWAHSSRDRDGKFWAMKVLSAECYGAGSDIFELKILQHLRTRGSSHPGSHHITMLEDSFEHEGPHGTHVCLIFKVMGESMSTFQKSFPNASIPSPLVQHFTTQLLQAIACAHDCDVVHTGTYTCSERCSRVQD